MKTYTVNHDFLMDAYNSACSDWKEKIKKEFPDAFKSKKIGKWYWANKEARENKTYLSCYNGAESYGFNWLGNWLEKLHVSSYYSIEATEQEVKEALIKEAEKIGVWNCPIINTKGYKERNRCYAESFDFEQNVLWSKFGRVFDNGIWATPIPKETEVTLTDLLDFYKEKKGIDNVKVV